MPPAASIFPETTLRSAQQRVAGKAGFTGEGVLRNAGITHSGRVDLIVFSLIRGDLTLLRSDR